MTHFASLRPPPDVTGVAAVIAYRLYLMTRTGRIERAFDLECEDDAQAIREAQTRAAGAMAELWSGKRLVKKLGDATKG